MSDPRTKKDKKTIMANPEPSKSRTIKSKDADPAVTVQFLKQVGRRIAKFRVRRGDTQVQFAQKMGVCAQMVQYWESGRNITLKTLHNLSRHLGHPVEDFFVDRLEENSFQGNLTFSWNGDQSTGPREGFPFETKLGDWHPGADGPAASSLPSDKLLLRMNLASWFKADPKMSASQKLKVLVVEDNPLDLRLLKEVFKEWGGGDFELLHEPSLQGAFKRLTQEKVDLILLDLFLPGSGGLETIAEIQKINSKIPLIILTGLYDDLMASQALQLGADFFLPKGFTQICALVRSLHDFAELQKLRSSSRDRMENSSHP